MACAAPAAMLVSTGMTEHAELTSPLIAPDDQLIDRDLSWLQFNRRVLSEASDNEHPLLERLKFLSITASNADEFFMIRFAALDRRLQTGPKEPADRSRLEAIHSRVLESARKMFQEQAKALSGIAKELAEAAIYIVRPVTLSDSSLELAAEAFQTDVLPLLHTITPALPDKIRELRNLQAAVLFPDSTMAALPLDAPGMVWRESGGAVYAWYVEDLISNFSARRFPDATAPVVIRVTRDADVTVELDGDPPEAIPNLVRESLRGRDHGKPVRLEFRPPKLAASGARAGAGNIPPAVAAAAQALKLSAPQIFSSPQPLTLRNSFALYNAVRATREHDRKLFFPPLRAMVPSTLATDAPIFENLESRDYILHHPYDSFDAYVNFIAAATRDPEVESIQQTVYRVDAASPIIDLLKQAAATKKVRVCIEPRARFDETNNIRLAEELHAAGVQVVFNSSKLKLHAKIALVTRRRGEALQTFTHLSTGNYNARTSREYTDFAIITAHPGIGEDAVRFFDAVALGKVPEGLKVLALAPTGLHRRIMNLIKAETAAAREGKPCRIFAKMNALVDESVIRCLYEASQAGVQCDLIVRGACSLIAGKKGLSENIQVHSIVDRFLEHSRIYYFQNQNQMYLSSADWMPRNFFSRLEVAFPILDKRIFSFLTDFVIPTYWADRQGSYAQIEFEKLALTDYVGTPLL